MHLEAHLHLLGRMALRRFAWNSCSAACFAVATSMLYTPGSAGASPGSGSFLPPSAALCTPAARTWLRSRGEHVRLRAAAGPHGCRVRAPGRCAARLEFWSGLGACFGALRILCRMDDMVSCVLGLWFPTGLCAPGQLFSTSTPFRLEVAPRVFSTCLRAFSSALHLHMPAARDTGEPEDDVELQRPLLFLWPEQFSF